MTMRGLFGANIAVGGDGFSVDTPRDILDAGAIPMMGYEEHLRAGTALCYAVAKSHQTRASVLLFGPSGTGKTTYARELAYRLNDLARSRHEDDALFTMVTVHAARLTAQSNVRALGKELTRVVRKQIRDRLPALLVVDELDILAPPRERSLDHRTMATSMISFLDSLPDKTVSLWITDDPVWADQEFLGKIRLTLYFDVPTEQAADSLLQHLKVPNGQQVAGLLYSESSRTRTRYSQGDLKQAVARLQKMDPGIFNASPEEIAEAIAAGCRAANVDAIDRYKRDYRELILQSECVLRRYTGLYRQFFENDSPA